MAWKAKTNVGRVVYDRPPHKFGARDLQRIQQKITSRTLAEQPTENFDTFAWILAQIINEISEYLLSVILAPEGLAFLSDNIVAAINAIINQVRSALSQYLSEARGPLGIPAGGVF